MKKELIYLKMKKLKFEMQLKVRAFIAYHSRRKKDLNKTKKNNLIIIEWM